jgi:outer membrane protein assembly factor BamA
VLKRLLVVACLVVSAPSLCAQGAPRPARDPEAINTTIRIVTLENSTRLSVKEQEDLVREIRRATSGERIADETPEDISDELAERVKAAYQNKGYFLAEVTARVIPVSIGKTGRSFDAVVEVLRERLQYRLRDIHCKNMTAFSEQQLLDVIPIHPGEIFSRVKIAEGLEALRRLYGSHGYVNFTSIPSTEIDDENASIALKIDVDEGGVFRFRNLSIVGLDDSKVQQFQRTWEQLRGQPYSQESLRSFFDKLVRSVPPGVDPVEYTTRRLDERARTVDVSITFAPQPFSRETQH